MLNRIPITAAGAAKLKAELDYLKKTARPNVVAAIAEAREKGDLSENAEYDAAREEQGHIEGRIAELEGKIPALQVIDPKTVASDRIVFGATVTLYNEEDDSSVTYQIVGDDEADIKKNLISVSSPIARALIGKEEGDTVKFMAPKGQVTYEVEAGASSPLAAAAARAIHSSAVGSSSSSAGRQRMRSLPIICTRAQPSSPAMRPKISSRSSRSSDGTRTLMSSCALRARSISFITASVRPLAPRRTTGSR